MSGRRGILLRPLEVQNRPQHPHHFHQLALRPRNCTNILVSRRRLIAQSLGLTEVVPHPAHLTLQLVRCNGPARFGTAQNPSRTMSARAQGAGATASRDVVTETPHRARKNATLSGPGGHGALAMNPQVPAFMSLSL